MVVLRNYALLCMVHFIYYMRAKTEEKHLMQDPEYRAYSEWIAEHGLMPKLTRRIRAAASSVRTQGTSA